MKPILAKAVEALPQVTIRNHVNITDFFVKDNRIQGASVSTFRTAPCMSLKPMPL